MRDEFPHLRGQQEIDALAEQVHTANRVAGALLILVAGWVLGILTVVAVLPGGWL